MRFKNKAAACSQEPSPELKLYQHRKLTVILLFGCEGNNDIMLQRVINSDNHHFFFF